MADQNHFESINKEVREMSREQGEERFASVNHIEVITYYERGAILHQGSRVWFENDQPRYEEWVLLTLRIPLDLAGRLIRVYLAMLHSGLSADDFKGIPLSSVLLMVPILRNVKINKVYAKELPQLLESARTGSVAEVKTLVYGMRGIKIPFPHIKASAYRRRTDWGRVCELLTTIGADLGHRDVPFAFYTRDPESGRGLWFCTHGNKDGIPSRGTSSTRYPNWLKVWKEKCVPLLSAASKKADSMDEYAKGIEEETIGRPLDETGFENLEPEEDAA